MAEGSGFELLVRFRTTSQPPIIQSLTAIAPSRQAHPEKRTQHRHVVSFRLTSSSCRAAMSYEPENSYVHGNQHKIARIAAPAEARTAGFVAGTVNLSPYGW